MTDEKTIICPRCKGYGQLCNYCGEPERLCECDTFGKEYEECWTCDGVGFIPTSEEEA